MVLGVIIRDEVGRFVAAGSQHCDGLVTPYMGELLAAKVSIPLAWELGKDKMELEVDAKNV